MAELPGAFVHRLCEFAKGEICKDQFISPFEAVLDPQNDNVSTDSSTKALKAILELSQLIS